jgi:hypothetical protein
LARCGALKMVFSISPSTGRGVVVEHMCCNIRVFFSRDDVGRVERCDVLCAIDFFLRVASDTGLTHACQNAVHEGICHMTFLIGRAGPIFSVTFYLLIFHENFHGEEIAASPRTLLHSRCYIRLRGYLFVASFLFFFIGIHAW